MADRTWMQSGRDGRRRHDPAEIRRLLRQRETEGLSYARLSVASGIPVPTLAWWAQRLRSEATKPGAAFVEVIADGGNGQPGADIEITLPSGISVRAAGTVDSEALARLVAAIQSAC